MSTFRILNTALSSLQAQQKSLDTTGHNISNANTEGYSRQRAELSTTRPYTKPGKTMPTSAGQVGTGVEVSEINRMRDQFIDGQIRQQKQSGGYWNKRSEGLERMELIFNEPSDNNLAQSLSSFRDSLQELSNNPEDSATRATVQQRGQTLADTFNELHRQISDYQESLDGDVAANVDEVNSIINRIGSLNEEIVRTKASGQQPNDLMDTRDKLLDELNELADVSTREEQDGSVSVTLGGTRIVTGNEVRELGVREDEDTGLNEVYHTHSGSEASINGGELHGLLEMRDDEINDYLEEVNSLARALTDHFNDVHRSGYDADGEPGGDFFTIEDDRDEAARVMDLTSDIRRSRSNIAAGNYSDNPSVARLNVDWLGEDFDPEDMDEDLSYQLDVESFRESETSFSFSEVAGEETKQDFNVEVEVDSEANTVTFTVEDGEGNELNEVVLDINYEEDIDNGDRDFAVDWDEGELNLTAEEGDLSDREIYERALQGIETDSLFVDEDEPDEPLLGNSFNFDIRESGEANISFEPSPGSGSNASALSKTIDEDELLIGDAEEPDTIKDYFEGVISSLGVDGQRADQMVENNEVLGERLENQRESISGVSLDEEMANMVKFQQAYAAAANVINTTQQNLDTLMGIVG